VTCKVSKPGERDGLHTVVEHQGVPPFEAQVVFSFVGPGEGSEHEGNEDDGKPPEEEDFRVQEAFDGELGHFTMVGGLEMTGFFTAILPHGPPEGNLTLIFGEVGASAFCRLSTGDMLSPVSGAADRMSAALSVQNERAPWHLARWKQSGFNV
jgi:hypothetical protein